MKTITVHIDNLDHVRAVFKAAPLRMGEEIHRAIQKSIMVLERNIKREAPVNKQTGGGNLRQLVKSEMIGYASGKVESGASYSGFVEFGTRPHEIRPRIKKGLANRRTDQFFGRLVHHPGTKANPFFSRGVEKSNPDIQKAFVKAVQNALQ